MLAPGDQAPAFTLVDQHGTNVSLSDFKGRRVVVFFYPKALTAGCTTQACGLRDVVPELEGVVVVGISPDPPDRQASFDEKHQLGFPLLSDPGHVVADQYGTWGEKSMYGRKYQGILRSAFLIDERGNVAASWYKISPKATATKVLAAVRS